MVVVPGSCPFDHQADWSFSCAPINLSLSEQLLSNGTREIAPSCPEFLSSYMGLPIPHGGLLIDAGPYGPILSDTTFGPCLHIHGLRLCPTTTDRYSILVLSAQVPGTSRPMAVEIGLTGTGLTACIILDSLRAG
jgi:hypothetical protein